MNWVGGSRNRFVVKNNEKRQRDFFEKRKMQLKLKNMGLAPPVSPRGTSSGSMDLVTLFIVNQIAAKKEIKDPPQVAFFGDREGRPKHKNNGPLALPMSPCSPSQLSLVEGDPQYSAQGQRKRKPANPQGFKCGQICQLFTTVKDTKFQPFSQPRGMKDCIPWSCGSNPPLNQLETPTAARVVFRSPEYKVCLDPARDTQPILGFSLSQSETEQRYDGDGFRGFSPEECGREAPLFGGGTLKINLSDETPAPSSRPQTVPDSQFIKGAGSNHMSLSNCTDGNFSCFEHNSGPMNGWGCSPSYSCSRGYFSSDSNDDEDGLQATSSNLDQAFCADTLKTFMGLQGNPKQRPTKPGPLLNFREEAKENAVFQVKSSGSSSQQTGTVTLQHATPPDLAQTQRSELCSCNKTANKTRDAGTQTVDCLAAETRNASTQCSVVDEAAVLNSCRPPVVVSVQRPATGRRTDTNAKSSAHTPSSHKWRSGEKHTPWTKKQSGTGSLSGSSCTNKSSDDSVTVQRPTNPLLNPLSTSDGRGITG